MPSDGPQVKFYKEKQDLISKMRGLVILKAIREDSKSKVYYDDKGQRLRVVPLAIPCRWVLKSIRGTEMWRYAETAIPGNVQGKFRYEPPSMLVTSQLELSPLEDVEKIFYFLFILGDKGMGQCGIYQHDAVKAARKKNESVAGDELDVRYQIFRNKEITDESMRQIALAWNITNAYEIDMEILRDVLFEKVMADHKKNPQDNQAMKAFLKDCRLGEVTELKAMVNKAVFENKIFRFDRNTRRWLYNGTGDYICQVPPDKVESKNQCLVEYFLKPERFEELQALRQEVWSEYIKPSYSLFDLDKLNTENEFRDVAKKYGKSIPMVMHKPETCKKWVIENCGIV
jgi:hypothetical protein